MKLFNSEGPGPSPEGELSDLTTADIPKQWKLVGGGSQEDVEANLEESRRAFEASMKSIHDMLEKADKATLFIQTNDTTITDNKAVIGELELDFTNHLQRLTKNFREYLTDRRNAQAYERLGINGEGEEWKK